MEFKSQLLLLVIFIYGIATLSSANPIIKDEIDLILEELELEKLSRAILNHSYQQSGSGNLLQTDVKRVYNSPQNHPDWKGQSSNTRIG
ncbi:hypothetical protein EB796_016437 [Bugula neritina]|uniref:Uncharacterized protein n=1 Tax=Bugula neritina TaxID=10212 RepID=A0A7J7JG36_BUGNE|nr:hypothetical protein EB796_016437 [Bugula neritina]